MWCRIRDPRRLPSYMEMEKRRKSNSNLIKLVCGVAFGYTVGNDLFAKQFKI